MPTAFRVTVPNAVLAGERHEVGDWYGTGIDTSASRSPLVLLHPGVGDQRCWQRVVPAWSTKRTIITYDRRGFGASSWQEAEHDHVDDLLAVLDAQQIDRAILVGNSMGAAAAIDLALDHPDRVAGLLLIAPAISGAPAPKDITDAVIDLDAKIDAAVDAGDLSLANTLEAALWLDGPGQPARVDPGARALFLEMNGRALQAPPVGQPRDRAPAWPRLAELSMPTLAVWGSLDLPLLRVRAQHLADTAAQGHFTQIDGTAHLPQLEAHQRTIAACASFLAALP